MIKKRKPEQWIVFLFTILILSSCSEGPIPSAMDSEEESEASDYMPFLIGGYLIRWQKNSNIRILLEDPTTVSGGTAAMNDYFKAGVAEWDSVLDYLGINVSYVSSGDNEIYVYWDDGSSLGSNIAGMAVYAEGSSPSRFIIMSTQGVPALHSIFIRSTAAHEFGHMLGIWDHSYDRDDTMNPVSAYAGSVSKRDIATIKYLYRFAPDYDLTSEGINDEWPNMAYKTSGSTGKAFVRDIQTFDIETSRIEFSFPEIKKPKHPYLK